MRRNGTSNTCLLLLALLTGCASAPPADSPPERPGASDTAAPAVKPANEETYQGILPCPDCEGLKVTLTLDHDAQAYRTTEVRLDDQDARSVPHQTSGPWAKHRGTETDPDAVIYQLDPDRPGSTRHFLRLDATRIKLLDEFKREFWSPFNLILERTD